MAKQSPKDPKFRCNNCKEYYHAPEHSVHYQCAIHGYLCEKHVGQQGQRFYAYDERKNSNATINYRFKKAMNVFEILEAEWVKGDPDSNPVFDTVVELPESLVNHCLCHPEQKLMVPFYTYLCSRTNDFLEKNGTKDWDFNKRCKKKLIKYNWSDEFNLWTEEGNENLSLYKKPTQSLNISSNNTEIKLLLELFEKNILTKEQFVEQLKEKL